MHDRASARRQTVFAAVLAASLLLVPLHGPSQDAVAAGTHPATGQAVVVAAAMKTSVSGWNAARRAPQPGQALRKVHISGPVGRPVNLQRKDAGKWRTVRHLRTTKGRKLDMSFVVQYPGRWRLVVRPWKGWKGHTTKQLRIKTSHSTAGGLYGVGFGMDGLGNMHLGGPNSPTNIVVSYRFRAEQTSTLKAFRAFWLGLEHAPNYAGGNGGRVRVTVHGDKAGRPAGKARASLVYAPGTGPYFPLLTFSKRARLTKGRLYHLVFTNIDPAPRVNFVSLDLGYIASPSEPRQPKLSDDWAALRMATDVGDQWSVEPEYTPILDLTYGNGTHQGQGYQWADSGNEAVIAGASRMVREQFVVSGRSRVVSKAAVRIAKTRGSGRLKVRLEDSRGRLIDSFTASTARVPRMPSTDDTPGGIWVSGSFRKPRTLAAGSRYHLRLSTDSATSLWTRPVEEGRLYGFGKGTYFSDGFLEVTWDGGSTWETSSGIGTAGDLQFYLR